MAQRTIKNIMKGTFDTLVQDTKTVLESEGITALEVFLIGAGIASLYFTVDYIKGKRNIEKARTSTGRGILIDVNTTGEDRVIKTD